MRFRLSGGRLDRPVVLYVGRLSPEKNLEVLCGISTPCPARDSRWSDDGPARAKLERDLRGSAAQFLGFLRGEELAAAFASADVFVMPSTTETLGFVVLEAMSSGLPVVAARAGGIPDLVEDGENGILYDPAEPADGGQGRGRAAHASGQATRSRRAGAPVGAASARGPTKPASSSTSTARPS